MFLIVWLLYDTFNTSCSWVDESQVPGMSASNNVPGYKLFFLTVMANNSTNINKKTDNLSSQTIEHKKTMT